VDFEEGWLRLDPGETKSGKGRMFPLIRQLRDVVEAQYIRKQAIERQTGKIITALFFREDGRPVRDFRRQWVRACRSAGHPDKIFHDLRRTAARNLVRAGVPTALAKKFTGHETDSVFQRYAIEDETSLREAGEKYAAKLGGSKKAQSVVAHLR
jgi:integrase